jgi:hypothetical protein
MRKQKKQWSAFILHSFFDRIYIFKNGFHALLLCESTVFLGQWQIHVLENGSKELYFFAADKSEFHSLFRNQKCIFKHNDTAVCCHKRIVIDLHFTICCILVLKKLSRSMFVC